MLWGPNAIVTYRTCFSREGPDPYPYPIWIHASVLGALTVLLIETVRLSTDNLCFGLEIRKIFSY